MSKIKDTLIEEQDTGVDLYGKRIAGVDFGYPTNIDFLNIRKCIGCGRRATRTNNTLCQDCWQNAEGENE